MGLVLRQLTITIYLKKLTKDSIQQEAVDLFKTQNLLLLWITGCGKSLALMKCVENRKCLIFIEKLNQEKNLKDDAEKHGYDISNWTFSHYNSARKFVDSSFEVVILDEADKINVNNVKFIRQINADKYLFATAEIDRERKDLLKSICKFKEFKITLTQAIKNKLLPEPTIYLIPLELSKAGKEELKRIESKIQYHKERAATWSPPDWDALCCLKAGGKRKELFNKEKLKILPYLRSLTSSQRTVYFFGNVKDSPSGMNLYHSKDPASKVHLDNFMEEKSQFISAIGQLTRGLNLPNIEVGVLLTLQKSNRDFIQKAGRILRSDNPIIYIPFVKESDDSKNIIKLLEGYGGDVQTLIV
jgi:superfamily II DNA or RNA helicase